MGLNIIEPIGALPTRVDTVQAFKLGTTASTSDGKEYRYVQASGAITGAGYAAVVNVESWLAIQATTANAAAKIGWLVGFAMAAMATGEYGWLQVKGAASIEVFASCAAGVRINTTATSGALDDDATVGARAIDGATLTTARAASQGSANAVLSDCRVGATI